MSLRHTLEQVRARGRQADGEPGVDRDAWVAAVRSLFATVRDYLRDYIADALIDLEERPVQRSEGVLGLYDTAELRLGVGDRLIVLSPVGRWVIGADGRVDMHVQGLRGQGYYLLWTMAPSPGGAWRLVAMSGDRPPIPLSKPAFEAALEHLVTVG